MFMLMITFLILMPIQVAPPLPFMVFYVRKLGIINPINCLINIQLILSNSIWDILNILNSCNVIITHRVIQFLSLLLFWDFKFRLLLLGFAFFEMVIIQGINKVGLYLLNVNRRWLSRGAVGKRFWFLLFFKIL